VLGVVHIIEPSDQPEKRGLTGIAEVHPTIVESVQLLTPVLIVIAVAVITGDPGTPGGGFQGGGLLAAVIVSRYLIRPVGKRTVGTMEIIEKVAYVIFVLSVVLYLFVGLRYADSTMVTYAPFMLAMNGLLGIKVFCGLTIVFLYFVSDDRGTASLGALPGKKGLSGGNAA
jgi:multicomponent Na+:H+ antiporter subunit B